MTRIRVCSECGGWSGCHFAGCPEDVEPEGDEPAAPTCKPDLQVQGSGAAAFSVAAGSTFFFTMKTHPTMKELDEILARNSGWHAQFEWKLADLWIGAFWKRTGNCIDLWICLLPCVPLHVSWWWSDPKQNR